MTGQLVSGFAKALWRQDQPIFIFDTSNKVLAVNPNLQQRLDAAGLTWQGRHWPDWFQPAPSSEQALKDALAQPGLENRFFARLNMGPSRAQEYQWSVMTLDPNDPKGARGCIGYEVTPSQAHDGYDEHLLLARILENTTDGMITINTMGLILSFNRAAERLFGYGAQEVLGRNVSMLMPSPHREQHDEYLYQYLETGVAKIIGKGREVQGLRKDGATFPFLLTTTTPFQIGSTRGFLGIVRDLSETKSIENQLRRAQKMESIGTLAGGIAHDFNNILGGISGYIELMLENAKVGSVLEEDLLDMKKACQRGRDLVLQILTFSRRDRAEHEPMRLQPIILESLKLLRATLPTTIHIVEDISEQCPPIVGDVSQIHQILMNLGTNAFHAMRGEGGRLSVSLKRIRLDKHFKGIKPDLPFREYNLLRVEDTGQGIKPDHLQRIFDPFFTTKAVGDGTGMGLAVVHGIVQSHKGDITVDSRLGEGSTFSVFLPLQEADPEERRTVGNDHHGGVEHLVVVDDDAMLLRVQTRILERSGYRVTAFANGRLALAALLDPEQSFDLLITDQTMPDLTGLELAQQLLMDQPHFPVILTTGFSEAVSAERASALGIRELLMKPVSKADLTSAIRRAFEVPRDAK